MTTMTQALKKLAAGTSETNKPATTASGQPSVGKAPGGTDNSKGSAPGPAPSGEPKVDAAPGTSSNATTASGQTSIGKAPEGGEKGTSVHGDTQALTKNAEERFDAAFAAGFEWGFSKAAAAEEEEQRDLAAEAAEQEIVEAMETLDQAGYDIEKMAADMPAFMKKDDDKKDDKKSDDKDEKKPEAKKDEKKDDKKSDEKK